MMTQIKETGRRVLHGAMSLILATSLVPTVPSASYASEVNSSPQTAEGIGGEHEQNSSREGQSDRSDGQELGQDQQSPEGGHEQPQNPAGPEGQAGQTSDDPQGPQRPQGAVTGDGSAIQEGEPQDEPRTLTTHASSLAKQLRGPADAPTVTGFTPTVTQGDTLAGEGDTHYYGTGRPLTITFVVTGTNLTEDFGTARLSYVLNEGSATTDTSAWTLNASRTEATATISLAEVGAYESLVPAVVVGDVEHASSVAGTYKIVPDDASITSVYLKGGEDAVYQKTEGTNFDANADEALSLADPTCVDATNARKIVVTVASSALDTATNSSYVKAWGHDGTQIGTTATFAKDGDAYVATLTEVTGKVALEIRTKNLGADTAHSKVLGGGVDSADDKIKASGALVIDEEHGPVIGFEYADAVTNDGSTGTVGRKVIRLANGGASVTITARDESFEAAGVSVSAKKDGSNFALSAPLEWTQSSADPDLHSTTLTFDEAGVYELSVAGADALGHAVENGPVVETFVVADAAPTATVTTDESRLNAAGQSRVYLKSDVSFNVAIRERFLDREHTTVAGYSLTQIEEALQNTSGELGSFVFSDLDVSAPHTYSLKVKYRAGVYSSPNDGIPVVRAKDWYLGGIKVSDGATAGGDPVPAGSYRPFTIDKSAPVVVYSKPATAANIDEVSKSNKVLFFNKTEAGPHDATTTLLFAISDDQGIASIVVSQADGTKKTAYDNFTWEDTTRPKQTNLRVGLLDSEKFTSAETITVTDLAGNSSTWALGGKTVAGVQSPIELVEDHTKPVLEFGTLPLEYNKDTVSVPLTIIEQNFSYLQRFAANTNPVVEIKRTNVDGSVTDLTGVSEFQFPIGNGAGDNDAKPVGGEEDYTWQMPLNIAAKDDHSNDGDYRITARLTDLANNTSEERTVSFTIDTTAPTFTVAYNKGEAPTQKTAADGTEYYGAARTATITVNEHNFDADCFAIAWDFENHAEGAAVPTYAWDDSATDVHTCTVTFPSDGEYVLKVSGTDKAGNAAVYAPANEPQYTSPTFVIDTEDPVIADVHERGKAPANLSAPAVEFPEPTGRYAGVNYYSHGIEVQARVMDRNFDPSSTTVYRHRNGAEARQNVAWSMEEDRDANGNGYQTYATKLTYAEDGNFKTPHVNVAVDHALNKSENTPKDFVVDLGAPNISVAVDKTPTSTGDGNEAKDPIQFYNTATKLTFTMHDEHLLDSYQLDDPDGAYVVGRTTQGIRGQADATLVVELKDGADAQNDTEYERNITLTVADIAGNRRIWTIDRTGKVVMDTVESGSANTPINGEDVFPVALVQDTTTPVVALAGVTAGSYYNSTQIVRATVNEFNFGYLKRFDPSRVIVYVTKREGSAGRAQSTWTVPASSFDGTRPTYAFDQPFEADGHYELYAEFLDYANNQSNRASIGEFTIDKTAPTISVTWDNTDVRNGKYYKASRTATITVMEHNFDPSLMSVTTNGAKRGWSSSGDTHTCTVSFATDGTYNLAVSGRDMAGNEAAAITEPEFIVDLTAPKITFGGRVQRYGVDRGQAGSSGEVVLENQYDADISQDGGSLDAQNPDETLQDRHAYNGVVMPAIEFYDQVGNGATNYDPSGVSYTITGGKHGDKTQDFARDEREGDGGQTYQLHDLGLVAEAKNEGDRNVYDPAADDVYTIKAQMTDRAGNEAEGTITFSVNRYGSNYLVEAYDETGALIAPLAQDDDMADYDMLGAAPRIQVREINVSGSESTDDHSVLKEYANVVSPIAAVAENDSRVDGYVIADGASEEVSGYGWSEYVYTIRQGNFGIGSPSDTGDGGQGTYRIDVASIDRASNDTSTAKYLDAADYEKRAGAEENRWADPTKTMSDIKESLKSATTRFTLDEVEPVIDVFNVPNPFAFGTSYTVTVHVTDAITRGDTVEVMLDGRVLDESEFVQHGTADGTGTYEFVIPASLVPFDTHEVKVSVRDTVRNRKPTEVVSGRFMVSMLLSEVGIIALVAGVVAGGVILYRKRREIAEPEAPGPYEQG